MAEPSPGPRSPKTWRDAPKAKQAGDQKTSSRGRKIFTILATLGFLAGAVAVSLWLIIRPAHPAFLVGLIITEYDDPHLPVNAQAGQDREAFKDVNYFRAESKNLYTEQELDPLANELKRLKNKQPEEPVVVYVSAHVLCDGKGDLYLLPGRAKTASPPAGWLPFRELLDDVSACPSQHKLLILDTMHNLADPRLGVLANDSASRIQALLENDKYRDLQVLCACSAGQTSWASPDLHRSVFGYYVTEGLRGLADAEGRGHVTVQGLYRFVRARVDRWAKENRTTPQTPVLVHPAKEDLELVRLEKGEVQPRAEANNAEEKYPDWLLKEWQQRDRWWDDQTFRAAPLAFLQLEAALLRAEQQWRGGTDADEIKESLGRRLTPLKERIDRSRKEVPQPEVPRSLALEVGLGLRKPDSKVGTDFKELWTKLKQVESAAKGDAAAARGDANAAIAAFLEKFKNQPDFDFQLDWFVFEQATRGANVGSEQIKLLDDLLAKRDSLLGRRRGEPQYVETLFLQRLAQFNKDGTPFPDIAPVALRVAHAGELAAACASESRRMCEPRAFPWIGELLEQAAQKRHEAEVLLFAPGFASLQEAGELFREAENDYRTLARYLDSLQDAYATYDEALARLPGYASYVMNRKEFSRDDKDRWSRLIQTVADLHPLLGRPLEEGQPPVAASALVVKIAEVQRATDSLRKDLNELSRPFRKDGDLRALLEQAKGASAGPAKYEEIDAALAIPWLRAEDRQSLWSAGQALSRRLCQATLEKDEQDGSQVPANLADFEGSKAERQELERAAGRAQLVLDLFKLGGWSSPEQLPEEISRATKDPLKWPALGDKLRKAWAELPKQLPKIAKPTDRDRLSRVIHPLDEIALRAEDNPSLQLRKRQAVALWSWLSSRYQYEYLDLHGLNEDSVSQFYSRAANDYRKLLGSKQPPDAYVEFDDPAIPEGKSASFLLGLIPQGAKETPVVSIVKNADFDVETQKGGDSQVHVHFSLRSDALKPKGFLVRAQLEGRTFHHKVIPPLPPAVKRHVELILSSQKDSPASALVDEVPLRPNQSQAFYAYVRNLDDMPKDVKVKFEVDGSTWNMESKPLKLGPKEMKLVEFDKPPGEKPPSLRRLDNGKKLRVLLVDAVKPADILDQKQVSVLLMPPSEYVTVTPQFTPGEKNRLEVVVRWNLATPIVGKCEVELVLDDIPGLAKIGKKRLGGSLDAKQHEVTLSAENLEFAEDRATDEGLIHVTVDGYERAFNYRMAFPREGGVSIGRATAPTIRVPPSKAIKSGEPYLLKLPTETTRRDVKIEVGMDRNNGDNFELEKTLLGAREERIEFNPCGEGGSLIFVTKVNDWQVPLLGDKQFKGKCRVQVRMLDPKGTLLEESFQTVTVDDTPPDVRFLKIDDTVVPKNRDEDKALEVEQLKPEILTVVAEGSDPESGIKEASFWVGEWVNDKPPATPPVPGKLLKDGKVTAELGPIRPGKVTISVQFTNNAKLSEHKTITLLVQPKAPPTPPKFGSIAGTAEVQGPQPNVKLSLKDAKGDTKETTSDDDGKFSFTDLAPGTYKLTAKFGTRVAEKELTVEAGKITAAPLTLREK